MASSLPSPIVGSSSCPIKCNLEAPSRAIRGASLPTSCNEAQHILESIAPLVSPNGTSLLSKKQCKWKWTYSLASRSEKPLVLSACNSCFQMHTHAHTHTHTEFLLFGSSSSGLLLQCAFFPCFQMCIEEDGVHVSHKIKKIHVEIWIITKLVLSLPRWDFLWKSRFHHKCLSKTFACLSQGSPALRSRSLSPASGVELGSGKRRKAEQRIEDLEELLQLKVTS